ncbi:GNAT family N-acetyltransferase [Oceanobacillus sp. CAU 1775]
MLIREIEKKDNKIVKEIIQNSLELHQLDIPGSAYFDPQLGYLYEYYKEIDHAKYWVVEVNGEVVGGVGIAPFNKEKGICELQKLYLKPTHLGLGLGKQLMDQALNYARTHYKACYLETMHKLAPAARLYEKLGFTLLSEPIPGSDHSAMDAWYLKEF